MNADRADVPKWLRLTWRSAILVALCIASVGAPPFAAVATAAKIHPSARTETFTAEQAERRFERVLELVADSNASNLIGHDRWAQLVTAHTPRIIESASHEVFAQRVNALIEDGGTSHFHYFPDSDWSYWHLGSFFDDRRNYDVAHIGVFPQQIDGVWFVRGVFEGSEAERAGVSVGDELVAVDGEPYAPIQSFRGKARQSVELRVRRTPGELLDVRVTPVVESLYKAMQRAIVASIRVVQHEDQSFAYVHGWTLLGDGGEYHRLLELQPKVDGLLLDYRDGFGGHWGAANRFLLGEKNGASSVNSWQKPVVILTADGTRSAKEIVVDAVRRRARAPLVGLPTPGHVVSVGRVRRVGDDALIMLPGSRFRLEGNPTVPDFLVTRTIPYCAGDDVQLDAAKAVLSTWIEGDSSSQLGASVHEVVTPVR